MYVQLIRGFMPDDKTDRVYYLQSELRKLKQFYLATCPKGLVNFAFQKVNYTVIESESGYYCFAYYTMKGEKGYEMILNPEKITQDFYSDIILHTYSKVSGKIAQADAIHGVIKHIQDVITPVTTGRDLEYVYNNRSLVPTNVPLPKVRYRYPDVPIPNKFVQLSAYAAAAPDRLPIYGGIECEICNRVRMWRGVIMKCCSKHAHYGCLHYVYQHAKNGLCPICRNPITLPRNRLIEEMADVTVTGCDMVSSTAAVFKMLVEPTMVGSPERLRRAYLLLDKKLKLYKYEGTVASPDFFDFSTYAMSYPTGAKCSLYFTMVKDKKGRMVKRVMKPTKKEAFYESVMFILKALNEFKDKFGADGTQADFNATMGMVVWMITLKVEALKESDKQRLYFIPMLIKFIVDKIVFSPGLKMLYNRSCYMVGFKWPGGGADHLFGKLKGEWGTRNLKRFFWEWDISRMDQAAKAFQISLNYAYLTKIYDRKNKNFKWLKYLAAWSIDNSASKLCKWFGDESWRIVVGILCSGEFLTSYSTTITSFIAFIVYVMVLIEHVEKLDEVNKYGELLDDLLENMTARFFGDDGIAGFNRGLAKIVYMSKSMIGQRKVMGLPEPDERYPSFEDVLKEYSGLTLKVAESAEYPVLWSRVNEFCDFTYKGPKILKRHFIPEVKDGLVRAVAFRPSSLWKAGTAVIENDFPGNHLIRFLGHIFDTFGNNERQYNMLSDMFDSVCNQYQIEDADNKILNLIDGAQHPDSVNYRQVASFVGSLKKMFGVDYTSENDIKQYITKPSLAFLRSKFNDPDYSYRPKPIMRDWYSLQEKERNDFYWWSNMNSNAKENSNAMVDLVDVADDDNPQ